MLEASTQGEELDMTTNVILEHFICMFENISLVCVQGFVGVFGFNSE